MAEKSMVSLQRQLLSLIGRLDQAIMLTHTKYQLAQEKGHSLTTTRNQEIVWANHIQVSMSCVVGQEKYGNVPFEEYKISTKTIYQDKIAIVMESRFFEAIDGLPLMSLRQCPECEHHFFHTSKREKTYCSNKCAAKKNARDKRAELKKEKGHEYKQELEDGRKRAKKSYAKRIKTKDDSESQKVERRPFNGKNREEEEL